MNTLFKEKYRFKRNCITRTLFFKNTMFFIDFQREIEKPNNINLSVTLEFTTDYRHESDTILGKESKKVKLPIDETQLKLLIISFLWICNSKENIKMLSSAYA